MLVLLRSGFMLCGRTIHDRLPSPDPRWLRPPRSPSRFGSTPPEPNPRTTPVSPDGGRSLSAGFTTANGFVLNGFVLNGFVLNGFVVTDPLCDVAIIHSALGCPQPGEWALCGTSDLRDGGRLTRPTPCWRA